MITKSTLLYGASGSFEEVTVKKWKTLRVMAHKASGNLTNITQRYRDQQTALRLTVALFKQVAAAVYAGWKESRSYPGEYAAFVGYTLRNAINFSTPGSPAMTYANLRVSKGSMPITVFAVPTADVSDNKITITFPTTVGYKQAATDMLNVAIYNTTQQKWLVLNDVVARSVGTIDITPPAGFLVASDSLTVHGFFTGEPSTDTAGTASDDVLIVKAVTA